MEAERKYLTPQIYLYKDVQCGITYIRYFNYVLNFQNILLVTINNGSYSINPDYSELTSQLWNDIKEFASL